MPPEQVCIPVGCVLPATDHIPRFSAYFGGKVDPLVGKPPLYDHVTSDLFWEEADPPLPHPPVDRVSDTPDFLLRLICALRAIRKHEFKKNFTK